MAQRLAQPDALERPAKAVALDSVMIRLDDAPLRSSSNGKAIWRIMLDAGAHGRGDGAAGAPELRAGSASCNTDLTTSSKDWRAGSAPSTTDRSSTSPSNSSS